MQMQDSSGSQKPMIVKHKQQRDNSKEIFQNTAN